MFIDDVIYVGLLLASVAFGSAFRRLPDATSKRWVSTGLGLAIAWIVSGRHVAHPMFSTLINAAILTQCSWRKRHVVSFFFMFFYLLVVFRLGHWFGLPEAPAHTNLIQMLLTLRLAGLGFEIDAAKREEARDVTSSVTAMQNVEFLDVIHYGFSYMGILTGPYYRYRTYWDCINKPYAKYTNCWEKTQGKLKTIAVLIVLHLISGYLFPSNYVPTDEFRSRSLLYRVWYVFPSFVTFRTRIYAGMTLSECVCQMAGLGAYPTSCETVSGLGPRKYKEAEELADDDDRLKKEEMDFETVHNIDIRGVETCHEVRKAMKLWNTTVQYWMAAYVYKQFPHKILRTPATFILSSLWHGYALGYHVTIVSVILFLPYEDMYIKFFKRTEEGSTARTAMHAMLFVVRLSCMSYLSMGFQTLTFHKTYGYYSDVYFCGHVIVGILWAIGHVVRNFVRATDKPRVERDVVKPDSKIQ